MWDTHSGRSLVQVEESAPVAAVPKATALVAAVPQATALVAQAEAALADVADVGPSGAVLAPGPRRELEDEEPPPVFPPLACHRPGP